MLDVSNNLLNHIPVQFSQFTSLLKLSLDENSITFLTDDLMLVMSKNMTSLGELSLDDNQVRS